jgi:hypothetical protein
MFENIRIIANTLNNPQHRDLTINQHVILIANTIDSNHISASRLLFEMIAYIIYVIITYTYNYTIWSLCKPFQTIQNINRVCSTVHYQIIPQEHRYYIYKQLFKTLIIDLIRMCIVGFIYFKIQNIFLWK